MILKIRWQRFELKPHEGGTIHDLVDEHDILIECDRVEVHGLPGVSPNMEAWEVGQWERYVGVTIGEGVTDEVQVRMSRLISAWRGDRQTFYEVSLAWLMNDRGDTIERLVP